MNSLLIYQTYSITFTFLLFTPSEDLTVDLIERIRLNILLNPRLLSNGFIPKKLIENVIFILPVLLTKNNILPSD